MNEASTQIRISSEIYEAARAYAAQNGFHSYGTPSVRLVLEWAFRQISNGQSTVPTRTVECSTPIAPPTPPTTNPVPEINSFSDLMNAI